MLAARSRSTPPSTTSGRRSRRRSSSNSGSSASTTESEWRPGSSLVHTGEWQGKPYVDKGEIVKLEPPTLLVHTHWSDLSGVPDRPENYQEVTWSVAPANGGKELTVSERNLPSEEAQEVSERAWKTVLGNLKEVLEG